MKDNVVHMPGAIVLLRGTLKGADREAECELLARKQTIPGVDQFGMRRYQYSQCSVLHAPFDLPDGEYTVTTEDGHVILTTRLHGLWLVGPAHCPGPGGAQERA
jgi:hypothetical protein